MIAKSAHKAVDSIVTKLFWFHEYYLLYLVNVILLVHSYLPVKREWNEKISIGVAFIFCIQYFKE